MLEDHLIAATVSWQDGAYSRDGVDVWADLPADFYTALPPTPLPQPYWIAISEDVAHMLEWDVANLTCAENLAFLAGNDCAKQSVDLLAVAALLPRATVYAGHQFGVWAGQLGDGRALCLGERRTSSGASYEIQIKGAGKTPYSRMGDGRAVLRSSIREFLCSEAMAGLGIPTTRALALIGSPYPVVRETMETAAVVTRVAPTFLRFGHFQHYFYRQQYTELEQLVNHTIRRYFPELDPTHPGRYAQWLRTIVTRHAELVADWQSVGFCHGVLNTDNMSILGLTLDYGPFGFLDRFAWQHICNHSDTHGRYAYAAQPEIVHWNLYALGQALRPLFSDQEELKAILEGFPVQYQATMWVRWLHKFGLAGHPDLEACERFIQETLQQIELNQVDFTLFFRQLCALMPTPTANDHTCVDLWLDRAAAASWLARYRELRQHNKVEWAETQERMRQYNPKYILRNYLAENAIRATQQGDFSEVKQLLSVLRRPYDEQPEHSAYAMPPPTWAHNLSVSCSS